MKYSVFCDESSHFEKDYYSAMVLGAVWCPTEDIREISHKIRDIKQKHHIDTWQEVKWTKVSPAIAPLYLDLMELYQYSSLNFRGIVIDSKQELNHEQYNQDFDTWYYKMYFLLLREIVTRENTYSIYIDKKDTRGSNKLHKLRDILCSNLLDHEQTIVRHIQEVPSHEIEILQVADVIMGAIAHVHKRNTSSAGKQRIVDRLKAITANDLKTTTPRASNKFNLFFWSPRRDDIPLDGKL